MAKALLFVGGGALQRRTLRWARSTGLFTVVADARPDAPGRREAHRFECVDGTDVAGLVDLARELERTRGLAGAFCNNDFGLPAVAAIGASTATPAASPESVRLALDKDAAAAVWNAAGLRGPAGRTVSGLAAARAALGALGTPAIVKPTTGSGSRGVRRVEHADELDAALAEALRHAPEARVEELARGRHLDVNAFLWRGRFHRAGLLERFFGPPPCCVPVWGVQPAELTPAEEEATWTLVEGAARALGIEVGPVKADVVLGSEGPTLLELAPRFHGEVSTAHVSPLCTGRSPIQDWLALLAEPGLELLGGSPPARCCAGWRAVPATAPGRLRGLRGAAAARAAAGVEGTLTIRRRGALLPPPGDNRSVCGFIWASGRDVHQVEERLSAAAACIRIEMEEETCRTSA